MMIDINCNIHDNDDRADILENDDQINDSESQIIIMNTTNNFDINLDVDKTSFNYL